MGTVGCSPADGFGWRFQGGWDESAHRSTGFLLGLQGLDIILIRGKAVFAMPKVVSPITIETSLEIK